MNKPTLFISYCWNDGMPYADDIERQLGKEFEIIRDKLQLLPNDDIYSYMAGISDYDNVVIVLTEKYLDSTNCLLEMSFLVEQEEWLAKTTILVVDHQIYDRKYKLKIIENWENKKKAVEEEKKESLIGKRVLNLEYESISKICENIEVFLCGISRRINPSQIALIDTIREKSKRDIQKEKQSLEEIQNNVEEYLRENDCSIVELKNKINRNEAVVRRILFRLSDKIIKKEDMDGVIRYKIK